MQRFLVYAKNKCDEISTQYFCQIRQKLYAQFIKLIRVDYSVEFHKQN